MLITVIIGLFLVASELVAELGVSASKNCDPALRTGPVLNASDIRDKHVKILLTTGIGLESIDFVDELTRISEGLPVHPSADTCMPCFDPNARNIVSNCSVTWWRKYDSLQLEIVLEYTMAGDIATKKFRETANPEKEYNGYGDYISTNGITSAFLFSFSETNDVQYVEYNGQAHLRNLGSQVQNAKERIVHETTRSPVNVYNISCGESILSRDNLASVYWTAFFALLRIKSPQMRLSKS